MLLNADGWLLSPPFVDAHFHPEPGGGHPRGAQRLAVVSGGVLVSRMPEATAALWLPGRPASVDFTRQADTGATRPHG